MPWVPFTWPQASLGLAIRRAGRRPKYVISDQGRQFRCKSFRRWCRDKGIRSRFGAVDGCGSLTIIERFMRSLKTVCTWQILVPLRLDAGRREIALYALWHHQHRPSQALGGRTPGEVRTGLLPASGSPRLGPRAAWPGEALCAAPQLDWTSSAAWLAQPRPYSRSPLRSRRRLRLPGVVDSLGFSDRACCAWPFPPGRPL